MAIKTYQVPFEISIQILRSNVTSAVFEATRGFNKDITGKNLFPLGQLLASQLLFGNLLLGGLIILDFGNDILLFRQDNFQMARAAHVWVDSSVSAVGTTTHVWSTVNLKNNNCQMNIPMTVMSAVHYLNVVNDQVINIETLKISIGLCILQQLQQKFSRLLGPTSLGSTPLFGLEK